MIGRINKNIKTVNKIPRSHSLRNTRTTISIHVINHCTVCHRNTNCFRIFRRTNILPNKTINNVNNDILCTAALCRRRQSIIEHCLCRIRVRICTGIIQTAHICTRKPSERHTDKHAMIPIARILTGRSRTIIIFIAAAFAATFIQRQHARNHFIYGIIC